MAGLLTDSLLWRWRLVFSWHNDMLHEGAKIVGTWIVTCSNTQLKGQKWWVPYGLARQNSEDHAKKMLIKRCSSPPKQTTTKILGKLSHSHIISQGFFIIWNSNKYFANTSHRTTKPWWISLCALLFNTSLTIYRINYSNTSFSKRNQCSESTKRAKSCHILRRARYHKIIVHGTPALFRLMSHNISRRTQWTPKSQHKLAHCTNWLHKHCEAAPCAKKESTETVMQCVRSVVDSFDCFD